MDTDDDNSKTFDYDEWIRDINNDINIDCEMPSLEAGTVEPSQMPSLAMDDTYDSEIPPEIAMDFQQQRPKRILPSFVTESIAKRKKERLFK